MQPANKRLRGSATSVAFVVVIWRYSSPSTVPATAITTHAVHATPSEISRRELYFFNLFRVFQATLIAGLIFSPMAVDWVALSHEQLARGIAIAYFIFATFNLFVGARSKTDVQTNVAIALAADIAATTIALYAIKNPPSGIAMLLMVNVGAGALLLPPRLAFFFAALATSASSVSRSSAA